MSKPPEKISKIIEKRARRNDLRGVGTAMMISWYSELVKEDGRAISFRDGVMVVQVDNPAAATELRYREEEIKKKINSRIGKEELKGFKYVL